MMTGEQLFKYYDIYSKYFYFSYIFSYNQEKIKPDIIEGLQDYTILFETLLSIYGYDSYDQMKHYYSARMSRLRRLKKRVINLLNTNNCYLVTLTFTDEFIDQPLRNKRQWCTRFLNKYSDAWIFNSDFGETTGRHHFHCIVADPVDYFNILDWPYGWLHVEKCDHNSGKLSNYVDKLSALSLHAVKNSTNGFKVSYSRHYKWSD